MLEKPNLPDETIINSLRDHYNLVTSEIEFLPIGNDATAWVYRADMENGAAYFLKLKKGEVYNPSLTIPRELYEQGIRQVVAPIPAQKGELAVKMDAYNLIVYPFIDGQTAMKQGMSKAQWIEFGTVLKRIHTAKFSAERVGQVREENFVIRPDWAAVIEKLMDIVDGNFEGDAIEKELAIFWTERREEIRQIVERTAALGRLMQEKSPGKVLCHSDIHTDNILLDGEGRLFIVDWDQPIFAPPERDLMFVVEDEDQDFFFQGYGETEIDRLGLAYYRYEWVVQEIADFAERVFFATDGGEATRLDAVAGFKQLFDLGDVVDMARASET
jgi:spectinomycin phosphotransferase